MRRLLLCTDLDRTWIANGAAAQSPQASEWLARFLNEYQVSLAYVTGRHQSLIQQAIGEYNLPWPHFAIADVGSMIYQVTSQQWEVSKEWSALLAKEWSDASKAELLARLAKIPELQLQEPAKQGSYKISYYVQAQADFNQLDQQITEVLQQLQMPTNPIWSHEEASQLRLLDLLPRGANKYKAIEHLILQQGFERSATVFAGDSGNDLDVFESDLPSIVVANASPEIKSWATAQRKATLYLAQGGLLSMNGNYQAGILEGLHHFWPEAREWLHENCVR